MAKYIEMRNSVILGTVIAYFAIMISPAFAVAVVDTTHSPKTTIVTESGDQLAVLFIWNGTTAYSCRMCNPNSRDK